MLILTNNTYIGVKQIQLITRSSDGNWWKIITIDNKEIEVSEEEYGFIKAKVGEFKYPLLCLSQAILNVENIVILPNPNPNIKICEDYQFYVPYGERLMVKLSKEDYKKIISYIEDEPNFMKLRDTKEITEKRKELENLSAEVNK